MNEIAHVVTRPARRQSGRWIERYSSTEVVRPRPAPRPVGPVSEPACASASNPSGDGGPAVRRVLQSRPVKLCLACALAAGVFWWVVANSGPRQGTVILHVMERDVEVALDGRVYHFPEMTDEPLVLHLPVGRYDFRVRRGDNMLHAESFTLGGGETMVLVAIRDARGVVHRKPKSPD